MSRGHKPRQARWPARADNFSMVNARATRHTLAELQAILVPIHEAHKALREGVASEIQWAVLSTAVTMALTIEQQGIVRGLGEHFRSAARALEGIQARAMTSGEWHPTALYYQELDDVSEAMRLHAYQLEQLSAGELARAHQVTFARARQAGATILSVQHGRSGAAP